MNTKCVKPVIYYAFRCLLMFVLAFSCFPVNIFANDQSVYWEIQNRFRLIKDSESEATLFKVAKIADFLEGYTSFGGRKDAESRISLVNNIVSSNRFGFPKMPDTHYDQKAQRYDVNYVRHPEAWRIVVGVHNAPPEANCDWSLDNKPVHGVGTCDQYLLDDPVGKGKHELLVRLNGTALPKQTIEARDILVVGMGDSYSSGEGTPDVPAKKGFWGWLSSAPEWLDQQCHRSLLGWQSLIAARIAAEDKHLSVTFVSRSCSGAEVRNISTPCDSKLPKSKEGGCYAGIESPLFKSNTGKYGEYLPPQIEHLREDLCTNIINGECSEIRYPDLVLMSIGGNDAHFGEVIEEILTSKEDDIKGFKKYIEKKGEDGINQLKISYPKMLNRLYDVKKGFGPNTHVVLANYPNPTFRDKQLLCGISQDPKSFEKFRHITNGILRLAVGKENQPKLILLTDDFIHHITGNVKNTPEEAIKNNKHSGLRQIGIGLQCMVNGDVAWTDVDPSKIAVEKKDECRKYWGSSGFLKVPPLGKLNIVYLRNSTEEALQLPGFEFNGYCRPEEDANGAWINTVEDSLSKQHTHNGGVHPNIYGQMFYVKRVWPTVNALKEKWRSDNWQNEKK